MKKKVKRYEKRVLKCCLLKEGSKTLKFGPKCCLNLPFVLKVDFCMLIGILKFNFITLLAVA